MVLLLCYLRSDKLIVEARAMCRCFEDHVRKLFFHYIVNGEYSVPVSVYSVPFFNIGKIVKVKYCALLFTICSRLLKRTNKLILILV